MSCLESVRADIKTHERLLAKYRQQIAELADCAAFRLEMLEKNGRSYYYKVKRGPRDAVSSPKRIYLGAAEHPEVVRLKRYYYLKNAIRRLESNLRALRRLERSYKDPDPNLMRTAFPLAYQFEEEGIFRDAGVIDVRKRMDEINMQSKPSAASLFHPEQLRHKTACGIKVRSKSEVILSNSYYARDIPQEYEKEHQINGVQLRPDFTLWSEKDHREILWEHFGMMHDAEYREQMIWKLAQYQQAGYQPGHNLILTFDDRDGNIDSLIIERILDVWF